MNKYILLFTFCIAFIGHSQDYQGSLDTPKTDGLHTIKITPKIRSAANDNIGHLRIMDNKNKEVPYVIIQSTNKTFSEFTPASIISKEVILDSVTIRTIENKTGKALDHFTLKIANTNINKNYTIYGSNDKSKWFGLVEKKLLTGLNSSTETSAEKTIYFPLNDYKYLRISFNDKNSLPINILDIGIYKSKFFTQTPTKLNQFEVETILFKEKKTTQLKFKSDESHKIDAISFKVNSDYFLRDARVIVKRTRKVKKREETYDEVITRFQLNSKNQNTIELSNLNVKEFYIEIDNQDNPTLNIKSVKLFQKPLYLISNLKLQDNYKLIVDKKLSTPSYDLGNFISDKTKAIDEIQVSNFSKTELKEKVSKDIPFWKTPFFMWICIILGGIAILYFAVGLLKDVANQEK